jgi:hypothetical protein
MQAKWVRIRIRLTIVMLIQIQVRKCFLIYSQQLHCFIFLVSIIGVIIFNSLDTILKFSANKCGLTLHLVEVDPDPTRSGIHNTDHCYIFFSTIVLGR